MIFKSFMANLFQLCYDYHLEIRGKFKPAWLKKNQDCWTKIPIRKSTDSYTLTNRQTHVFFIAQGLEINLAWNTSSLYSAVTRYPKAHSLTIYHENYIFRIELYFHQHCKKKSGNLCVIYDDDEEWTNLEDPVVYMGIFAIFYSL